MKLICKRPVNPAYPKEVKTIGDHIRKTRLDRDLSQPQVAKMIGVTTNCVTNWELHRSPPRISLIPLIINFFGYNPFEKEVMTFGQKVKAFRYLKGLQVKVLAKQIGIDPATLTRIENDKKYFEKSYIKVMNYLNLVN